MRARWASSASTRRATSSASVEGGSTSSNQLVPRSRSGSRPRNRKRTPWARGFARRISASLWASIRPRSTGAITASGTSARAASRAAAPWGAKLVAKPRAAQASPRRLARARLPSAINATPLSVDSAALLADREAEVAAELERQMLHQHAVAGVEDRPRASSPPARAAARRARLAEVDEETATACRPGAARPR